LEAIDSLLKPSSKGLGVLIMLCFSTPDSTRQLVLSLFKIFGLAVQPIQSMFEGTDEGLGVEGLLGGDRS
jgi:hypothetical protein